MTVGIIKNPLKTIRNLKKHNQSGILASSKLNSIEIKICEALRNNRIIHEYFTTIINGELKESIKIKKKKNNWKQKEINQ